MEKEGGREEKQKEEESKRQGETNLYIEVLFLFSFSLTHFLSIFIINI